MSSGLTGVTDKSIFETTECLPEELFPTILSKV